MICHPLKRPDLPVKEAQIEPKKAKEELGPFYTNFGTEQRAVLLSSRYKLLDGYHSSFSGFNVSCLWQEVAVSTVSFSLLFPVLSFSVVRFEYSFVYVSLHSA